MVPYLKKFVDAVCGVGAWGILLWQTVVACFKRPPAWRLCLEQFYQIGVLSLPVVAITGLSTGMVLAAQSFYQLGDRGLADATGLFVGKSMLTEVGPVLTAFMVTGRVGSSICAMIGTMKVTEQVDALRSMAVNPLRYLVAPRILGTVLMLPCLTIFSAVMGIYGGYLVSHIVFHMSKGAYFDLMPDSISPFDVWMGIIKATFFALFISSISCYKGLTTRGGAAGVGKATTNSVVICYSAILIFNFLLTIALNMLHVAYLEEGVS